MVKKLAFVGTGIAAVLIAMSPLAFAADEPDQTDQSTQTTQTDQTDDTDQQTSGDKSVLGDTNSPSEQTGLVNLGDVNALNGTNVCPDVGVAAALLGGEQGDSDDSAALVCDSLGGNNNDE